MAPTYLTVVDYLGERFPPVIVRHVVDGPALKDWPKYEPANMGGGSGS